VRADEPRLWLPLYHSVRYNEKYASCFELGGGGTKDADINPVERMGPTSNSRNMVSLVGGRVYGFDTFLCVESRGYK